MSVYNSSSERSVCSGLPKTSQHTEGKKPICIVRTKITSPMSCADIRTNGSTSVSASGRRSFYVTLPVFELDYFKLPTALCAKSCV